MNRHSAHRSFQPQFQSFLYASIGDDADGMPVSVLSALARSDVDPWTEAETLTRLPYAEASTQLRSLIAHIPEPPAKPRDLDQTVRRLLALLPRSGPGATARSILHAIDSRERFSALKTGVLIGVMLTTQWAVTSCYPRLANGIHPTTPAATVEPTPQDNPSRE